MSKILRYVSLVSGSGTTAEYTIKQCQEPDGLLYGLAEPAVVISSHPGVGALKRADKLGVPWVVIERKKFKKDRPAFGEAILEVLAKYDVKLVCQHGFIVMTPENVIQAYLNWIINQHPGYLEPGKPDFGGRGMMGMAVHAARLIFARMVGRDPWTEAIAQRVSIGAYDGGAILHRKTVPIDKFDDVESLQEKVLPIEWEVQTEVIKMFAEGTVRELPPHETPLVQPGEEKAIEYAKFIARLLYHPKTMKKSEREEFIVMTKAAGFLAA